MKKVLHLGVAAAAALFPLAALAGGRYVTATVYHKWYHGRADACGGTYSDSRVTAAHPWLPCGSRVLVRHNGRSLVVPITDRCNCGSIDLSYKAAKLLGVPTDGVAQVLIQEL